MSDDLTTETARMVKFMKSENCYKFSVFSVFSAEVISLYQLKNIDYIHWRNEKSYLTIDGFCIDIFVLFKISESIPQTIYIILLAYIFYTCTAHTYTHKYFAWLRTHLLFGKGLTLELCEQKESATLARERWTVLICMWSVLSCCAFYVCYFEETCIFGIVKCIFLQLITAWKRRSVQKASSTEYQQQIFIFI